MDKADLRIDWATHEAAKYACENWHYSKSVPVPPLVKVGVWENGIYIGVVIFSRGASSNLLSPYGLKQSEGCELTRIALTNHIAPVSRVIRLAMQFLKRNSPELRLLVSFADPQYGHHGGVYQAGNWLYAGDTASSVEYWSAGKRLHSRQVSEKGWNIQQGAKRKTVRPSECVIVKTVGKHRYLMPLDDEIRQRILSLSKPYPKRAKQAISGDQPPERQGSTDPRAPQGLDA
jgi:hypothetical protein